MDRTRARTTYVLLGGAAALLVVAAVATPRHVTPPPPPPLTHIPPLTYTPPPPPPGDSKRPRVDVVFALDTTGSMSALLEGAKKKVWEISRFIAQGQPAPELRVGLIGYRDTGDEYVTKFFDLTDDLDAVYQNLSAFTAAGGGDTPEHVSRALHEAVNRTHWSPGKNTLRIVYLVGDAPPHTDYSDGFNYKAIAQQAGERGIRVNTIRCGADADTERFWREIAGRAHGEYASIDQSGGVVDVHTPFDDELAGLNGRLSGTAYGYGSVERRREVSAKAAASAAAPAAVQAERAGWFGLAGRKGKVAATSGEGDLVDDIANKRVSVEGLAKDSLPEPMQALSADERKKFVEDKVRERKEILDKINDVSARRDAFLKAKPAAPGGDKGFDAKVRSSLKNQAADIGLAL